MEGEEAGREEASMICVVPRSGGRWESFSEKLSIRIRCEGFERRAAKHAERPTAPVPKIAMLEFIGGRRTLLGGVLVVGVMVGGIFVG